MGYIYRYKDLKDNKIKYIGIVYGNKNSIKTRHWQHKGKDKWCKLSDFECEYLDYEVTNKTDLHLLEAHFIGKYKTFNYFNISKGDWGESNLIIDIPDNWKTLDKLITKKGDGDYLPKVFEIPGEILVSPQFIQLEKSARVLFLYMLLEKAKNPFNELFYFPKTMYFDVYELYKNGKQFNRDKKRLIQSGFIEEVENGHLSRTKNIYRISDKWKNAE